MEHKDRLVEVQLRTQAQNAWADLVEELGHATGHALKNGAGPPQLLADLAGLAEQMARSEGAGPYAPSGHVKGGREMAEIIRFLLIYDHEMGRLVGQPREFQGDAAAVAAFDAYDEAEEYYADRRDRFEVLLVGATSLESVKAMYARFFDRGSDALASFG